MICRDIRVLSLMADTMIGVKFNGLFRDGTFYMCASLFADDREIIHFQD